MTTLALVVPPNPYNMKGFPGSVLALELWVRKHLPDVETLIFDEEDTPKTYLVESLERKLEGIGRNLYVGITCTTATYQDAIQTARAVKQILPDAKTILGGHHVNGQEWVILDNHPEVDITVTGEGEKALEGILRGEKNVPGVTYRNPLRLVTQKHTNGTRLTYEELNLMDVRKFNPKYQKMSTQFGEVNLITARGCPMDCAFCAVSNEKATAQDPELVIEQVDYLIRQRPGCTIAIQDNFFAQNPERAAEIARELIEYRAKTGMAFDWNMQTRVEQFADKELAALMAKAGCTAAYFGVENFDPRMLKILNKAHNERRYLEVTRLAIRNCLQYGISPHIDFQVGIPGEDGTTEEINYNALQSVGEEAKSYKIKPLVFPSLSVVYPATGFYKHMVGLGAPRDIFELFTRWERENTAYREMLYGYFAHGNGGIPLGIIDVDELKKGDLSIDLQKLRRIKSYVDQLRTIKTVVVHDYALPTRESVAQNGN